MPDSEFKIQTVVPHSIGELVLPGQMDVWGSVGGNADDHSITKSIWDYILSEDHLS